MNHINNALKYLDRDQWRDWLEGHHQDEDVAWLVIYKQRYRDEGFGLDQADEEALCDGWIDSTLNRLDEKRYLLRFSPRKEDSIWSISNIQRAEQLIREGRMTRAGLARIEQAKENGQWQAALEREQTDIIPEDLETALVSLPGGLDAYRALPHSRKKQLIYWLQSAKKAETRSKRIKSIIDEVLHE